MAPWDVYRIPVDVALVQRTGGPGYQPETALLRQMLHDFRPPAWCQEVLVVADAASASRAIVALIHTRGYGSVLALPRTWTFTTGNARKDVVTHRPRGKETQMRIPTVNPPRRRTLWVYAKRAQRRHVGDVTVVLSKCRRHHGPQQTTILVTHRPETVPAREMVGVYLRRWWSELLVKEWKGVVGLGQHRVTTKADRLARSVVVAIMA